MARITAGLGRCVDDVVADALSRGNAAAGGHRLRRPTPDATL
jgi:hypothetical protein